jgi:modulator of FtsH protease
MIPTVIGAWAGLTFGFANFAAVHPIISAVGYLALAAALIAAVYVTKDSPVGIVFLMGFTLVVGIFLSAELSAVLKHANGGKLIMLAAGGTAVIFAAMATIATVSTVNFSKMGPCLFVALLIIIVASVANMFLHLPILMVIISVVAIIVFSLYLIYDINQIVTGGEGNAIIATLQIYLDLINIFVNLLSLLEAFSDD